MTLFLDRQFKVVMGLFIYLFVAIDNIMVSRAEV